METKEQIKILEDEYCKVSARLLKNQQILKDLQERQYRELNYIFQKLEELGEQTFTLSKRLRELELQKADEILKEGC